MIRIARRLPAFVLLVILAGCNSMPPTAPSGARMTLAISQDSLPVGGTAVVTATVREMSGAPVAYALVTLSSSMGTFTPAEAYTVGGVATSTFTATRPGIGAIGALSGSVASESLLVRVGEFPALPPIVTPTPAPAVYLSCNNGTAGVPTICSLSGANLQAVTMNWGDGSPEESVSPVASSVAHVFPRADRYTVIARGAGQAGQVAHASATATISSPPAPPAPVAPPTVPATYVTMTQEANLGTGSCAAFNVGAVPATGAAIASIGVTKAGAPVASFSAASGRFVTCGLTANTDILTATATDSNGATATYQLIVR